MTAATLKGKHRADKAGLSLVASQPLTIVRLVWKRLPFVLLVFDRRFLFRDPTAPLPHPIGFMLRWFPAVSQVKSRSLPGSGGSWGTPPAPPRPVSTCPGLLGNCRIPGSWIFPPPCLCWCEGLFRDDPPSVVCLESCSTSPTPVSRIPPTYPPSRSPSLTPGLGKGSSLRRRVPCGLEPPIADPDCLRVSSPRWTTGEGAGSGPLCSHLPALGLALTRAEEYY